MDKLNEIFDTDEGARYVGEFSLGFNPAFSIAYISLKYFKIFTFSNLFV